MIPKAVVEGLRWLSPIQCASSRLATRNLEIFGSQLKEGDTVFMGYGSANRDDREFERPDVYDLDRPVHPHLAFGAGRHSCAGSNFAPEVARIALEELFGRFPALEQDPHSQVPIHGFFFRGPTELSVRLG
jgi:aromatic O-demethylase, cytochrome P450 subunit